MYQYWSGNVVAEWPLSIQEIKDDAATISAGAVILSRYQNVYPAVMPIAYYLDQPEITIINGIVRLGRLSLLCQ